MIRTKAATLLSLCFLLCGLSLAGSENPEKTIFNLYKWQQPVGIEISTTEKKEDATEIHTVFSFTDRGTTVPLASRLTLDRNGVPMQFTIWGKTSRPTEINASVVISGKRIEIKNTRGTRTVETPAHFFTVGGYAPAILTEQLFRYWNTHERPDRVQIFPDGTYVSFERRGQDEVTNDEGKQVTLQRWAVKGLGWGRETIWLDETGTMVALKSVDAEFDHFEAVRRGYSEALSKLVSSSAADGMENLREVSDSLLKMKGDSLVVFTGATLIDGTGSDPVANSAVVVENGRITAAGPRASISIPAKAKVIDLSGKTLLPGLWDMHAHFEQVEWGPVYLAAGVTAVRDCANEMDFITSVRDAIEAGKGLGPHLLLACIVDGPAKSSIGLNILRTKEDIPAMIKTFQDAKCDQVKIYSSLSPDLIEPLSKAAHESGMTVTGHIPDGIGAVNAVDRGMDMINHILYLSRALLPPSYDPDTKIPRAEYIRALNEIDTSSASAQKTLSFFAEHKTVVDPTLALYELFTHTKDEIAQSEPGLARVAPQLAEPLGAIGVDPADAERGHREFNAYMSVLKALHQAGVPIVAGTDQAIPGHSLHREMELYVEAGFTPMEAIQSATIVPARVMKKERDLGTIEAGRIADMIVVDGNPLADIHELRKVSTVVFGGRVYDTAALWKLVNFTP